MAEDFSDRKRRFVRLTEQELARLEQWQLPEVGSHPTVDQLGEQLGYRLPQATAEAQPEQEPETAQVSITAAELEEIRQAAYEEGLNQGLTEGRAQGHAEGLDQGLAEGREKGEAEGREQGYQAGLERADQYLAGERRQLQALLDNLAQPASRIDVALLNELRELACLVAEAVLYREVETAQGMILGLFKRGLDTLPSLHQQIKVYLHPEDRLVLEKAWSGPDPDVDLVLISDGELTRGDCRLVTETSQVEFNWQQRLADLKSQLLATPLDAPALTPLSSPQPPTSPTQEPADNELGSQPVDAVPATTTE